MSKNIEKNLSLDVSIYGTLFCSDVTPYRDTMRYLNMPNLLVLLYKIRQKYGSISNNLLLHWN